MGYSHIDTPLMEQKDIDKRLMIAFRDGYADDHDLAFIHLYFTDHTYRESLEQFLAEEWQRSSSGDYPVTPELKEKYLRWLLVLREKGIAKGPAAERNMPAAGMHSAPVRLLRRVAGVAAAVILLLAGLGGYRWWGQGHQQAPTLADQWIRHSTRPGKQSRILLPDSTVAYLAPGSTLQYHTDYGAGNRDLYLEGEAYFIAHHQPGQPLRVITGEITTVDIGTEFDVRYVKKLSQIDVTVARGLVDVIRVNQGEGVRLASLRKWNKLRFQTDRQSFDTSTLTSDDQVAGWREGVLSFNKARMSDVAEALERYYGVEIHFGHAAIADYEITTTIHTGDIRDAMEIISLTTGTHYRREGDTIWIK